MEAILISVITSLIASFIFWWFFNYIPSKIRSNKIRPKVEFDIYEIYIQLLFYLQTPLQINAYRHFYSQNCLCAGLVRREDFSFCLQNKCLNDTYKFDEMQDKLIPIGDKLEEISKDICEKIEKCSTYYSFMTADEILLLRKISAKITLYSYTDNSTEVIGGSVLRPLIPNLSYMADNFYEIRQLFDKLQEIVWKYKKVDRSINEYIISDFSLNKAQKAYMHSKYKKCIWLLKCKSSDHPIEAYSLLFQAYYNIGERKKALFYLNKYLNNTTLKPIHIRNTFEDIYKKEKTLGVDIIEILLQYYSYIEIVEMINEIIRERYILDNAIKVNQEILNFYNSKKENNEMLAKERMSQKYKTIEEQISETQKLDSK